MKRVVQTNIKRIIIIIILIITTNKRIGKMQKYNKRNNTLSLNRSKYSETHAHLHSFTHLTHSHKQTSRKCGSNAAKPTQKSTPWATRTWKMSHLQVPGHAVHLFMGLRMSISVSERCVCVCVCVYVCMCERERKKSIIF